jgi:DNA polymerase I-like protein with 3'-5' exonuclease and polymerase domains
MAGCSGDQRMIEDCLAGDVHWQFGVRAGLIPADGNKDDDAYQEVRQKSCKPVVLGMNYGMSPYGVAARTKRPLIWARDIHARHRLIYPTFHNWLRDTIVQARFDGQLESPLRWPLAVIAGTKTRTLMNFPAQAGGADAMRLASIAGVEAGISVCASVHDAFWIMAPTPEIDDAIACMRDIMERAGAAVSNGLPIPVTVEAVVHGPQNLGEVRRAKAEAKRAKAGGPAAPDMWSEVWALIEGWEAGGRS